MHFHHKVSSAKRRRATVKKNQGYRAQQRLARKELLMKAFNAFVENRERQTGLAIMLLMERAGFGQM
jgi:hypothetical protein